jgi:hypothetical protein
MIVKHAVNALRPRMSERSQGEMNSFKIKQVSRKENSGRIAGLSRFRLMLGRVRRA